MAAPATPSNASANPGLTEDSTMGSPTPVSMLETPAPANEVSSYGTQANQLDPYLYQNFITVATLTWSTSALAGTLLWYTPIHPSRANPRVDYFTRAYNTWAGGLEYKMKVAGTGFHAGALAVVRLPPNIRPSQLRTPSDWETFGYDLIDPKTLELISKDALDQKPIMYHYTADYNEADPSTFGGYLCLFVRMPLQTSATGNNQINITVWNRLAADFMVAQMRPVTFNEGPVDTTAAAQALFPFEKTLYSSPYIPLQIKQLVIKVGGTPRLTKGSYGRTNFSGESVDTAPWKPIDWSYGYQSINIAKFYQMTNGKTGNPNGGDYSRPLICTNIASTTAKTQGVYYCGLNPGADLPASPNWDRGSFNPFGGSSNTAYCFSPSYVSFSISDDPAPTELIISGESFVLWRGQHETMPAGSPPYLSTMDSIQSTAQITALRTVSKRLIGLDQAYLFQIQDILTGLPVRYLKVYYNGVITTNSTITEIVLNWDNYQCVPVGPILATDVIPSNTSMAANMMMTQIRDRHEAMSSNLAIAAQ